MHADIWVGPTVVPPDHAILRTQVDLRSLVERAAAGAAALSGGDVVVRSPTGLARWRTSINLALPDHAVQVQRMGAQCSHRQGKR